MDEEDSEENLVLTSRRVTKGKKFIASSRGVTGSVKPNKYLSRIKNSVASWEEFSLYASQCPQSKKGKGTKIKKKKVVALAEEDH